MALRQRLDRLERALAEQVDPAGHSTAEFQLALHRVYGDGGPPPPILPDRIFREQCNAAMDRVYGGETR